MLMPTSLPTIYDLVDPESNLAGFADAETQQRLAHYEFGLGGPQFVVADGTWIGEGSNCVTPMYTQTPELGLGDLLEKEKWAIALGVASLYLGWVLFYGKRSPGSDRNYGSMI